MANGRKFPELREQRQYLDNEIYQINKSLEAEGANGASGAWLAEQRRRKQALFNEIDYVIEHYGEDEAQSVEAIIGRAQTLAIVLVAAASAILSILAYMK